MRIQKYTPVQGETKSQNTNQQHRSYTPSFKAGGLNGSLNFFGMLMQWIEDGGFLMSFLIQDSIGMTAPRAAAGFLRDKEVTGKYNKQEGFEVLGHIQTSRSQFFRRFNHWIILLVQSGSS